MRQRIQLFLTLLGTRKSDSGAASRGSSFWLGGSTPPHFWSLWHTSVTEACGVDGGEAFRSKSKGFFLTGGSGQRIRLVVVSRL